MGRDVSVISAHPCSENFSVRSIITAETPVDRDARIRAFFLKAVQGVPVPQGDRSADPIFHLIKHRGTSLYETFRSKALAVPASGHPVSRLLYGISAHRRFVYSLEEGYNFASQTYFGVGTYNYSYVLHDPYFLQAVKNTLLLVVITVPVSTGLALLISLGLSSIKPLRDLFQTIYFLPYVTNTLAVAWCS